MREEISFFKMIDDIIVNKKIKYSTSTRSDTATESCNNDYVLSLYYSCKFTKVNGNIPPFQLKTGHT